MTVKTEDPKTFDLMAALQGRSYPEDTVVVFLDEGAMYSYSRASEMAERDPANKALQKSVDGILKEMKDLAYKVHLKGVPREVRVALYKQTVEDFPLKKDSLGNIQENLDFEEAFNQGEWELYVVGIEAPDGSKASLNSDVIKAFRGTAPQASVEAVNVAIAGLRDGAVSGYEQTVQGLNFLSQPSLKG